MQSSKSNRFYEAVPAILTWATLIGMLVASRFTPVWAAIFIIVFDIYWFFKTVFLSLHLRYAFNKTRANLEIDWLEEVKKLEKPWEDFYHLIVLPMATETYEVIKETFDSLKNIDYPKDKIIIVLSTEERLKDGIEIARRIDAQYADEFYKLLITEHPANIEGEIIGSGSNETWGAKEATRLIIDKEGIPHEKILVSIFDADTQVPKGYFGRLMYCYLTAEKP